MSAPISTERPAVTASPAPKRPTPPALARFITAVIAVGSMVIAYSLYQLPATLDPMGSLAFGVLALVAATFALKVPGIPVYISISDTFFITSALMFGPAPATLAIALDSLLISWRRKNNVRQLLFNTTSSPIALWCGVQVYYALSQSPPLAGVSEPPHATMVVPLACLAAVYFGLNSGLTAIAVALSKGVPVIRLWRQHFAIISLNYFAAASASFFLIVMMRNVGVPAMAAVLPLIFICYLAMKSWLGRVDDAQQHVTAINRLYLSTIGALSTAIEAKDSVTSDHIHRVQAYALGLAHALGITDGPTLQAIEAASLLHDTGKLAVPEHILNKPGKLTFDEFETMKLHVDVGADILSSIEFPYPVVPIVRAHHENWDGSGYPGRLSGEGIPIGARILSVVDCFDALTSDRPYRGAMTEAQALAIIVERRGKMYDPAVVDMFLRVYRDIAPIAEPRPDLQNAVSRIRRAHAIQVPRPAVLRNPATEPAATDASDEMLAFVSLARVAARTPTIGDIGSLAWGHLRQLAPGASLALYTIDPARGVLVAAYAAGPAAWRLNGFTIGVGERVSGWVAANWRPMLNSDAHLDLPDGLAEDLRFALAIPLIADGILVGVITLYAPEPFAEERSRRLEMIAPHLAASISSALADGDAMTGTATAASDSTRPRGGRPDLRVVARR